MRKLLILCIIICVPSVLAATAEKMDKIMISLLKLMPYLTDEKQFLAPNNKDKIMNEMEELTQNFKSLDHDMLLKQDLFAPSYEMINDNLKEAKSTFKNGDKRYAQWLLKESISTCLDCHTRLPTYHTSKYQNGELQVDTKNISHPYDLGLTFLVVRRFVDAKNYFVRDIQDRFIKKDTEELILPFQQILMIETKIRKNPKDMISFIDSYLGRKDLPWEVSYELKGWRKRLEIWKNEKFLSSGLKNEEEVHQFIKKKLSPLESESFEDQFKVDFLLASGILSNYFFENPNTKLAPELSYWIGWLEKRLKRESFISSGDQFLKQCIRKYPTSPIAKKCLDEYKESVEFDFTGSSGTHIPLERKKEIEEFEKLLKSSK